MNLLPRICVTLFEDNPNNASTTNGGCSQVVHHLIGLWRNLTTGPDRPLSATLLIGNPWLFHLVSGNLKHTFREQTAMEKLYYFCAIIGGTILACQMLATLMGIGSDHELAETGADHDFELGSDSSVGEQPAAEHVSPEIGLLTFRTCVAAVTFFGFVGMAGHTSGVSTGGTLAMAIGAGAIAMYSVAWAMSRLYRLRAEGTAYIERAIGSAGTVYLPIPAGRQGAGKVLLNIQNRTMEYQAISSDGELLTGTTIIVTGIAGPDTVEVAVAPILEPGDTLSA